MIYYDFLVLMKEHGFLQGMKQTCLTNQHLAYMEIYAYHLDHPKLSQFQIAVHFNCSKKYVYNAYHTMNQPFTIG